jgi:2-C-methyl-D-erythritol 4-phosphate cytidylyltransferase
MREIVGSGVRQVALPRIHRMSSFAAPGAGLSAVSPQSAPRLFALVPCAGVGARAGADRPKQYVELAGKPLVAHTLNALAQVRRLSATLVVLSPADEMFQALVPGFVGPRGWIAHCGGETRAQSVAAGLEALLRLGAQAEDWVLVHDAARCLLQPAWVDRLIDACESDDVGGLLALPLADTLKAEQGGRVQSTVSRSGKWAAQTPQMFRLGLLRQALAVASGQEDFVVTDESSAVEALGLQPRLVAGSVENFKVTFPEDFALAERLLSTRGPQPLLQQPDDVRHHQGQRHP